MSRLTKYLVSTFCITWSCWLTEAALMYFNRHHMWVDLIIPWGVFNGFAKQDFSKYL